ncbi:hypothetical protein [Dyadobacter fanqingshengii]|uniref:Uncharacterized protein n=1 Tax=Dyadobacter fanqingshengii TaxID=2906443 RepID=A0A9X1P9K0_9BACT|nr:hypothetical protein [Dyadobacter fanqingshengii]MCF0040199.1 hypothetical protein [Dyadobacter fanqingshengii]MCF2502313.1 hypothetical protein [Dyadobacter fanqingshengii]USJ38052.1 hypothetical protein NFI81_09740 [Dyadobacter fanqingshengii]
MQLKVSLFIILAAGTFGCVDIPDFSDTPKIYYNGIYSEPEQDSSGKNIRENVIITIDFEDGDGDLGASADERSDSSFVRPYGNWGNYELVTARKGRDGRWTESILAEDQYKWMPILKPDGKPGPIKGKIDLNTSFLYGNSTVPVYVRFKVRIRDRALHVSDQIQTDSVQVPGYL